MFTNHMYVINMDKPDFTLNNLYWLIYCKTKPFPLRNFDW